MVFKYIKRILPSIILLILSFWSIQPLFTAGFFPMHDDTQIARVHQMHKALSDGMIPVRWVADLGYGYGYPIFNFYAPFSYYVGGIISLIGFDSLTATKIMIGIGMLLAGVFMYLLTRKFWGEMGAILAGLLYVYAPYHAVNLYVRGAIAELWAYALIPLVVLSILNLFKTLQVSRPSWLWFLLSSISFAAIITSHNLTALMVTPMLLIFTVILYIFLSKKTLKNIMYLGSWILIGLMLSCFYWLPVIFEMKYTDVLSVVGGGSDYKDHYICISQLWSGIWGYAGSGPGCLDGMSFQIGKLHILLAGLSFIVFILKWHNQQVRKLLLFSFIGIFTSIFFLLEYSKPLWDILSPMAFLQFPWRFLVLVNFFIAILGGAFIFLFSKPYKYLIGILLISLVIYTNADVFVPSKIYPRTNNDYVNKKAIAWDASRLSDEYLPPHFMIPKKAEDIATKKFVAIDQETKISITEDSTIKTTARIDASKDTKILLTTAYFPAWNISIDGSAAKYRAVNNGIEVNMPQGKHTFEAKFIQTPIEKVANSVSFIGVLILLAGIIIRRDAKNEGDKKKKNA